MQRERTVSRPAPEGGGPPPPDDPGVDTILARQILTAADQILDSIQPVNAELYLQQNRQRGGQ